MFFEDWQTNEKYKDAEIRLSLLWDCDMKGFDWNESRSAVVERVVKLGVMSDFYAAFRLYGGLDNFIKILRDEVRGLNRQDISFVKAVFHLNEDELHSVKKAKEREIALGFKPSDLPGMEWVW
ncbi:MAG: hypothetical protein LBV32_04060 [Tannerellaceae bacterium]|nr:hypothetical protein [Tannerellaceae bacterium]